MIVSVSLVADSQWWKPASCQLWFDWAWTTELFWELCLATAFDWL